jgi:hypothetical protein
VRLLLDEMISPRIVAALLGEHPDERALQNQVIHLP